MVGSAEQRPYAVTTIAARRGSSSVRAAARVAAIVTATCLTWPAAAAAQGGEGTTPLFTVSLGTTFWTAVVFFALLAILGRFAWGPILDAVEARERGIQSQLDEARRRNGEAAKLLDEHRRQLAEARRQASEIVADGRAAGERLRQELEEKARAEARHLVERARAEIGRERDAALDSLRRESVELALAAASRLMRERLDGDRDRRLVEGYLEDVVGRRGVEA